MLARESEELLCMCQGSLDRENQQVFQNESQKSQGQMF